MINKRSIGDKFMEEKKDIMLTPQLEELPNGVSPRLIDKGMLYYEASIAGATERYVRGETSHTIHVWWARRPHSAMRAVVYASLSKDTSDKAFSLLKSVGEGGVAKNCDEIAVALDSFDSQYDNEPKVLDMFGGGGTIPFEVANIGAKSYSIDANQLSVFIQTCNLVYSQNIDEENISDIIEDAGNRVLRRVESSTEELFPKRHSSESGIIAYFWTYKYECEECKFNYILNKRPWVSKKKKNLAFVMKSDETKQWVELEEVEKDYKLESNWIGRSSKLRCPKCGKEVNDISIKKCVDIPIGCVIKNKGRGKNFTNEIDGVVPKKEFLIEKQQQLLERLNTELPDSLLPKWSGIVNPAIYGIETHSDAQNLRQRIVLLTLIEELIKEYEDLKKSYNENTSKYVISLLSGLIDQLVDWNCRISMWISQNEQVGRAFSGPGIPMYWDYIEIDPVMGGPANLKDKLKRIVAGANSIVKFKHMPVVKHAYAQKLPFEDNFFDAIVTDPPYYDNIYYTVLADFFFAWKKILLKHIEPKLFSSNETDKSHELVASTYRSESNFKAHEDYCIQLTMAIKEAARTLKGDGVFSFVYAHSSINGWEAIVRAFRESKFVITSVEPLSIERKQRPRAMTSQAVNTCMTFVAHKSNQTKKSIGINELTEKFQRICKVFSTSLKDAGWSEDDIAIALYANAVALIANVSNVDEIDDNIEVLKIMAKYVKEEVPSFDIKVRKSL